MDKFNGLIGSKLCNITRFCDLIKLDFQLLDKVICIHIQKALLRVSEFNNIIITSWDMGIPGKNFKKKLFKRFKWDIVGMTLYDDEVKNNEDKLLNSIVKKTTFYKKDLSIEFENNIKIEIFADTLVPDYEIFRIFELNNLDSHFVVET